MRTRKPTGRVAFPLLLLAGEAGSGKTWAAVEATGMQEVGQAWMIEIGEGQADEYGAVPGADFEIIEHDGTIGQIREAVRWASSQPVDEGTYPLLIIDSMTELWQLITAEAQVAANRRGRGRKNADGDRQITMDLWNRANETWEGIITQLRQFPGLVLMTARMKITSVVNDEGQPTGQKDWKIEAQKNLPYRAQVVMEARAPRVWTMTKIATTVPELQLQPGKETTFNDFSVEKLVRTMGVTPETAAPTVSTAHATGELSDEAEAQREQVAQAARVEAEKEAQRRQYAEWESSQMDGLMQAERDGDLAKLEKARTYYSQHSHRRLAQMAAQIIDRLGSAAPTAAEAAETVQEVLDAEPVNN